MANLDNSSLFSSPRKRSVVASLLLVAAVLVVYNPVARHPFVNFDDDRYVTNNSHIRSGLSWLTVHWAFTTYDQANWHPLTWLSHALDYQLFHLNPAGHHYVNVLLQALNAVLLFLVLQSATSFTWRSLTVAALFALHPVNVESVAWVAERKTLLSMTFFLLALWAYGLYARKPRAAPYALTFLLFACGLMAKPMVITFPFVLLLWDHWPLGRLWREEVAGSHSLAWLVLEKVPLLALSAGSAAITMKAQHAGGAVRSVVEYPLLLRLENAIVAYARYVGKAWWPSPLAPMYPHAESIPLWLVAACCVFLLAVTAFVLAERRRRYLAVGWFWFLGTLVPMIGLVQVGVAALADRYAYLPFVGLFVMICWGAPDLVEYLAAEKAHPSKNWLVAPAAAALIVLALLTRHQLNYWNDNVELWTHTLAVTENNFVAEDNLGGALVLEGRFQEAMPHFAAAAKINRDDPVANLNLATHLQEEGHLEQAVARYQVVLRMTSDPVLRANTLSNLGAAYRSLGDSARAKESYEAALRLVPETPHAYVGLGLLAEKAGDFNQAATDYARAMALQPTDVGYVLLSQALRRAGHEAEAQAAYEDAKRLSSNINQTQEAANRLLQ